MTNTKTKYKTIIKLLLFTALILILSCKEKKSGYEETLIINLEAQPKTIDPSLNSQTYGFIYINHAFEGLLSKDTENNIIPGVAESFELLKDNVTYIFHLRTNAKWSDGKTVTANDFVYAYRRAVDYKTASELSYLMDIIKNAKDINKGNMEVESLGVKALDNYTLEITLEAPTLYFPNLVSSGGIYMPVRRDIIERYGDKWSYNPETYICNGAYIMTLRTPDEKIVFEINTNYWNMQKQKAKKITFLLMADEYTALNGVRIGDIDFSITAPPIAEIKNLIKENYLAINNIIGTYYLDVNTKDEILKDKKIRKALSLAIDRDYIVSNIGYGKLISANAFVPPVVEGVNKTFREESEDYTNKKSYAENVELAQNLMSEAGYRGGNGFPIIEIRVAPGFYSTVMEAIQQMWKENLGIDIIIRQEDSKISLEARKAGTYQLVRASWTGDYNDPLTMLEIMKSDNDINYTGFSNKEYDDLIDYAKTATNASQRMEALHKAEYIIIDEVPIIPFIYRTDFLVVNPKFKDYYMDPLGRYKFNYSYIED